MSNTLVICPFHADSLPSLNVNLESGVFYCHGCGAKGTLLRHPELIPLAQQARGEFSRLSRGIPSVPPLAGLPKEYMLNRGFTEEVLTHFEIGGNQDRVWIPVKLRDDSLVGVIFRFVVGEDRYRYSYGFRKRNHLFGSKQFVEHEDTVYVVEGALDCIRMHQIGVCNVIGLLGDQPSSGQLGLIKSLGHKVILALDNDGPGWSATLSVGKLLQHRGHTVQLLSYEGQDPGELSDNRSFEIFPFLKFLLALQPHEIAGIEVMS